MRNRTPSAALRPPASPTVSDRPPPTWSPAGSSGTLLAVYPVNGGSARMAIVGYLLPREPGCRPADAIRPVTALQRGRSSPNPALPPAPPAPLPLAAGGLVLDTAGRRARVGERDAGLVYLEFELLQFLVVNAGRAVTRVEIFRSVWGEEPYAATRTVDIHVHRIRRKLGPEHGRNLVTVRRIGYRYEVPAAD
jgi:Transcriptional regulatory protein, C terminal